MLAARGAIYMLCVTTCRKTVIQWIKCRITQNNTCGKYKSIDRINIYIETMIK